MGGKSLSEQVSESFIGNLHQRSCDETNLDSKPKVELEH